MIWVMTFDPTLAENLSPPEPFAPDPLIARAERWLCMLGWLLDLGSWLTGGLAHQAAPGVNEPKWSGPWIVFPKRFDPSVVYERLCRAVRLALALQMKIEADIRALRAGKLPNWAAPSRGMVFEPASLSDKYKDDGCEGPETEREAPERAEAPERPENLASELDESFRERERFHKLLNGPLKDAVAAICADLGLKPDWRQWTDDGFPPPEGDDVRTWSIFATAEGEGSTPALAVPDPVWRPRWPRPRRPKPGQPSPEDAIAIRRWEKGLPP